MSYLVEDVARRHGRIRVGAASSYLRCDDEALLGEIAADRRLAALRLRRLAPMVLASQAPPDVVLERLRAAGYAPAAETPEGDVLVHRADAKRAPVRRPAARLVSTTPSAAPALLDAAVRAVRAGDRALTAVKRRDVRDPEEGSMRVPRNGTADILALLAEGVRAAAPLWIGYVNAEGHATQRVVEPISVEGGYVEGLRPPARRGADFRDPPDHRCISHRRNRLVTFERFDGPLEGKPTPITGRLFRRRCPVQQVRVQRRSARPRTDETSASGRTPTASDTTSADQVLAQIEAVLSEA